MNDYYKIVELWSGMFGIEKRYTEKPVSAFSPVLPKYKIVTEFTLLSDAETWMRLNAPQQIKREVQ